jgi:predicted secreted protein
MAITSALVLYAVIWFMTLFVALPIGLRTQGDEKDVVHGTHESSPANFNLRRKLLWVTLAATAIFVPVVAVIASGWITVEMIDPFSASRPVVAPGG